jgi:hypothetical protein
MVVTPPDAAACATSERVVQWWEAHRGPRHEAFPVRPAWFIKVYVDVDEARQEIEVAQVQHAWQLRAVPQAHRSDKTVLALDGGRLQTCSIWQNDVSRSDTEQGHYSRAE